MSVVTYQRGDTTALSKNFTRDEFECQCGRCTAQMIDTELVDKLQRIRDVLGVPLKITSGYRCIPHNVAVKGSSGSKHRYGMAADWRTANRSINPVALGILAQTVGFGGIGIYWHSRGAFVHADTRGTKATWLCTTPGQHHLPEIHFADHPPGLYRGCKQSGYKDAPAVAGADPGRHFWRKNRKRPAESAGEAQAGRGRHLRSCQLEGHFRGFQVPVKHPI